MNWRTNIVDLLLQKGGIDIESEEQNGQTALSLAAFNGSPEIVKLLLQHGANVQSMDKTGKTALSLVTKKISEGYYTNGESRIIRSLVENGADVDLEDEEGKTPMLYAASSDMRGALLQLLSPEIRRRIIICCDGTWNDRETKQPFTNVTRILSCIEPQDDTNNNRYDQLPYYIDGIGTGTTWLGRGKSGATGSGISRKIREAYRHVCSTYVQDGDEIVLIGFSRGAYTIQCLARLINDIGIIHNASVNKELPRIFDLWATGQSPTEDGDLKNHCERLVSDRMLRRNVKIKAYAAWDTVRSLGSPWPNPFRKSEQRFDFMDEKLPPNVTKAYHALALDERRYYFQPTILVPSKPEQLKQCWFRGSHSDIGGGGENSGLANITLCWMISQLRDAVKFNHESCWYATASGSILHYNMAKENTDILGVEKYNSFSSVWRFAGSRTRSIGKSRMEPTDPTGGCQIDRNHNDMYETIHFSVRVLKDIAVLQPQDQSNPLKEFKCSESAPYSWSANIAGQDVRIDEDKQSDYEVGMLHRWIDRDSNFRDLVTRDLVRLGHIRRPDDPTSVPLDEIVRD
ncbi:hypothetical protein COCVIDRAFT_32114 [Bipolaris victoriae FI3]|uniref:T6SS Phospholipase effector Tle1-like catalytic domain-containing protein n=1 Tax=Bipolaris victoriae (strain FI3) TaxID=930091 RepID=W7DZR7_BIPV3|nr:hypothetical protein COCVIDRAFT_32114 [Bipolaris victoriae FI3]